MESDQCAKEAGGRTTIIAGEMGDQSGDGLLVGQSGDVAVVSQSGDVAVVSQSGDGSVINQSGHNATGNHSNNKAITNPPSAYALTNQPIDTPTNQTHTNTPTKHPTPSSSGWQVVNSVATRLTARSIAVIEEALPKDSPSAPAASLWENSLFVTLLLHLDDVPAATPLHRRSLQSCSSFCC